MGDADNPSLLFQYTGPNRAVAQLETVFRSIALCPKPKDRGEPDPFVSKTAELAPIMASYRKAKALAAHFIDAWKVASNADAIRVELRRRFRDAAGSWQRERRLEHLDQHLVLAAWLGHDDPVVREANAEAASSPSRR
jgi:hypothetical protein